MGWDRTHGSCQLRGSEKSAYRFPCTGRHRVKHGILVQAAARLQTVGNWATHALRSAQEVEALALSHGTLAATRRGPFRVGGDRALVRYRPRGPGSPEESLWSGKMRGGWVPGNMGALGWSLGSGGPVSKWPQRRPEKGGLWPGPRASSKPH